MNLRSIVTILLLWGSCLVAEDRHPDRFWPGWRGPQHNGSSMAGTYVAQFGAEKNVLWKTQLPGLGCSTPIVYGERILLTCPVDGQDAVLSFDWTGKLRWKAIIGPERRGKHRNGSGCNPSAVTDGKLVFAYFKSGHLAAVDMVGKVLWKTNLQQRFAKDTLYWDLGTSPVLAREVVVVAVMHKGESYLAAFEKETGNLRWKVARNYKTPVEGDHSYATPHVVTQDGKEMLIVWGAEHLTGHSVDDGKLVWSCGEFNPQRKGNWVAVASSVLTDDLAIVPYGRGSHLCAVKLHGKGDVTDSHRVWTRHDTGAFVPTPAVSDGKIYLVRDKGEVLCINPADGKTIWKGQFPRRGAAKYYGSPVVADGKIFAPREDGVILVASIGDKFQFLSANDMQQRVIASPVPVAGRLLIRGEKHLFCIGTR